MFSWLFLGNDDFNLNVCVCFHFANDRGHKSRNSYPNANYSRSYICKTIN